MFNNGNWDLNSLSFPLHDQLAIAITDSIPNLSPMEEDKLIWGTTSNV